MSRIYKKPTIKRRALSAYSIIYTQWFYQIDSYIKEFIVTPEVSTVDDVPVYADKVKGKLVDLRSLIAFNIDFFQIMNNRKIPASTLCLEPLEALYTHISFDTLDDLEPLDENVLEELSGCLKDMRTSLNKLSLAEAADIVLTIRIKDLIHNT
ncbi:MAG TPA: hypothetical protein VFC79_07430 [Tissierellaceae bacterium]|nr:hypothetical protein [Tissierellaceae bacterium]